MKGFPYRQPRCRVCGSPAFGGTQARPLCIHCEQTEKEIHELLTVPAQKMHEQAEELRKEADNLDRYAKAEIVFANPCWCGLSNDCHEPECPCRNYGRFLAKVSAEAEAYFQNIKDHQEYWQSFPQYAADTKPADWIEL